MVENSESMVVNQYLQGSLKLLIKQHIIGSFFCSQYWLMSFCKYECTRLIVSSMAITLLLKTSRVSNLCDLIHYSKNKILVTAGKHWQGAFLEEIFKQKENY